MPPFQKNPDKQRLARKIDEPVRVAPENPGITVGNSGGPKFEIDNRFLFGKHLSVIGSSMGTRSDFARVMDLVYSGKLIPVMDRDYPLSEARSAQDQLERGEQLGKITLSNG